MVYHDFIIYWDKDQIAEKYVENNRLDIFIYKENENEINLIDVAIPPPQT